jgi:hypothetical protein
MIKDIEKILHGCFHQKEGRPNLHKDIRGKSAIMTQGSSMKSDVGKD